MSRSGKDEPCNPVSADAGTTPRHETARSKRLRSCYRNDCLWDSAIFGQFTPAVVKQSLEEFAVELFTPGDIILDRDAASSKLFFLNKGKVDISLGDNFVATLLQDTLFGEMGIQSEQRRQAIFRAADVCDCRVVSFNVFRRLLKGFPQDMALFEKLAVDRQRDYERWSASIPRHLEESDKIFCAKGHMQKTKATSGLAFARRKTISAIEIPTDLDVLQCTRISLSQQSRAGSSSSPRRGSSSSARNSSSRNASASRSPSGEFGRNNMGFSLFKILPGRGDDEESLLSHGSTPHSEAGNEDAVEPTKRQAASTKNKVVPPRLPPPLGRPLMRDTKRRVTRECLGVEEDLPVQVYGGTLPDNCTRVTSRSHTLSDIQEPTRGRHCAEVRAFSKKSITANSDLTLEWPVSLESVSKDPQSAMRAAGGSIVGFKASPKAGHSKTPRSGRDQSPAQGQTDCARRSLKTSMLPLSPA